MEFIFKLFDGLPRQGPGDFENTKKAFNLLKNLPAVPNILDVGCGTGEQTLTLAKLSHGLITAIDIYGPFLSKLRKKAEKEGVLDRITTLKKNMDAMKFKDNSFNLIWSEGAIYFMGFKRGLKKWKKILKKNGYIVVSHISWLKKDIPTELKEFWDEEYPSITTVQENIKVIKELNYELIGHFTLPDTVWWDNFYKYLKERINSFREKYKNDLEAKKIMDHEEMEMDLFRKYSDFYGYVFYIMQKK